MTSCDLRSFRDLSDICFLQINCLLREELTFNSNKSSRVNRVNMFHQRTEQNGSVAGCGKANILSFQAFENTNHCCITGNTRLIVYSHTSFFVRL